jgi:hypothetical protein
MVLAGRNALAGAMLSLMHRLDVGEMENFGDSTGALPLSAGVSEQAGDERCEGRVSAFVMTS